MNSLPIPPHSKPTPDQAKALWLKGNLNYKLHEGQKLIRRTIRALPATTRESLIFCSRRYGKSYLACVMALEDCLRTPNANVLFVGPSIKQTLDIVRLLFPEILADAPKGLVQVSKSEKRWQFSNGSQLMLAGFDTAAESVRGLRANSIYLEESGSADAETFEYVIKSILYPTLMHSRGRIIHLTTPALTIDHPLHTQTIPNTDLEGAFFKYTIRDNPLITPEVIEAEIRSLGGYDSPHTKRELFCEIVKDENIIVVPQFDDRRHVKETSLPDDCYYWVAGDVGGVRDKSVFLLCAYDYQIDKVVIVKEVAADPQTPTSVIVNNARAMEGGRELSRFVDAPGQLFVDLSATYNYPCFPPEKLEFEHNIHRLQTAFYNDQIVVDPSCKLLITTLRSGQLNKQKTDFSRSANMGHCDALAALVYALRHSDRRKVVKPRKPGTFDAKRDIARDTMSGDTGLAKLRGLFNKDD
jgi:hypothetical protein